MFKFTSILTIVAILISSFPVFASPVNGTRILQGRIDGRDEARTVLHLKGDEVTTIAVRSLDGADIDCYVFDENGNAGPYDDDNTSICNIRLEPVWSGPFVLLVKNRASRPTNIEGRVF